MDEAWDALYQAIEAAEQARSDAFGKAQKEYEAAISTARAAYTDYRLLEGQEESNG